MTINESRIGKDVGKQLLLEEAEEIHEEFQDRWSLGPG
jgi:hypothetical protein